MYVCMYVLCWFHPPACQKWVSVNLTVICVSKRNCISQEAVTLPITHKLVTDIQNFCVPNEQAEIDEVINGCREQNQVQVFMKRNADEYRLSCAKSDSQIWGFFRFWTVYGI